MLLRWTMIKFFFSLRDLKLWWFWTQMMQSALSLSVRMKYCLWPLLNEHCPFSHFCRPLPFLQFVNKFGWLRSFWNGFRLKGKVSSRLKYQSFIKPMAALWQLYGSFRECILFHPVDSGGLSSCPGWEKPGQTELSESRINSQVFKGRFSWAASS